MNLDRPIAFIDIESTGVDPVLDRIIEIGVTVLGTDGTVTGHWECRFNPEMPIPAGSTAVHGITDEDVRECQLFRDKVRAIAAGLRDKDLAGYNLRRLDLPILDEEFRRCGMRLDLHIDIRAQAGKPRKVLRAHRVSWEMSNGRSVPDGLVVRHKCDNPQCVNPDHLELGTQADNVSDCRIRGRKNSARGERINKSKLTGLKVLAIRKLSASKSSRKIASIFGVSHSAIGNILRGETWRHV